MRKCTKLMKRTSFRIGSITVLALATSATTACAAGTDILHFSDRANFTNNDASAASGTVIARENKQGHADNETVSLTFKGLDTNAPYTLQVMTADETNLADASTFTSDPKGKAKVNFR